MNRFTRLLATIDLDRRDTTLMLGLGLLTLGCGMAWEPLGFIVPGGVLTGLATLGIRR